MRFPIVAFSQLHIDSNSHSQTCAVVLQFTDTEHLASWVRSMHPKTGTMSGQSKGLNTVKRLYNEVLYNKVLRNHALYRSTGCKGRTPHSSQ